MKKIQILCLALLCILAGCSKPGMDTMAADHQISTIDVDSILAQTGSDALVNYAWLNNTQIVVQTYKQQSPEAFCNTLLMYDITTNAFTQLYTGERTTHPPLLYDVLYEDTLNWRFAFFDGSLLGCVDGEISEDSPGPADDLYQCRDVRSQAIYYWNPEQHTVYALQGDVTRALYQVEDEDHAVLCFDIAPDGSELLFVLVENDLTAVKTVLVDLTSYEVTEIDKAMHMPFYFWHQGELFALSNTFSNANDMLSYLYTGENLDSGFVYVFDPYGFLEVNYLYSNAGNAQKFGVLLRYTENNASAYEVLKFVLRDGEPQFETLYRTEMQNVYLVSPCISPDGQSVLFMEQNFTNGTYALKLCSDT